MNIPRKPTAADHRSLAGRTASHTAAVFAVCAALAGLSACQPAVYPSTAASSPSLGLLQVDASTIDPRAEPSPAALVMAQVDLNDKVRDVALTAEINAELAHDPALRGLLIEVDAVGGHVALRGEAPDAATRELVTERAARVPGVRSIDNQLLIGGGRG